MITRYSSSLIVLLAALLLLVPLSGEAQTITRDKKQQTSKTTPKKKKNKSNSRTQSSVNRKKNTTNRHTSDDNNLSPSSLPPVIQQLIDDMIYVEGGTFQMGATKEQQDKAHSNEFPVHDVTLSSYYIAKYEVTQELWQTVMGYNPSENKGDNLPVENVSWDDCQVFLSKLNALTGKEFRLPTEAEWEYAARGGIRGGRYSYSGYGWGDIEDYAWCWKNSGDRLLQGDDEEWDSTMIVNNNCRTHEIGTKKSNSLHLHDMSGNVFEWCQDWFGDYTETNQTNPKGPSSGDVRIVRGGSIFNKIWYCRVSFRAGLNPIDKFNNLGFRVALSNSLPKITTEIQFIIDNMVLVKGGTFLQGSSSNEGDVPNYSSNQVTLSDFYMSKFEVTQKQWKAIMVNNPSHIKGDDLPVESISEEECKEFIRKLNAITGKGFRLPTDAEWEYAACGGNYSKHYKFSGSNDKDLVAWNKSNSEKSTHPVGKKRPNELGLFDMSGNVGEWCVFIGSSNNEFLSFLGSSYCNDSYIHPVSTDGNRIFEYKDIGMRVAM